MEYMVDIEVEVYHTQSTLTVTLSSNLNSYGQGRSGPGWGEKMKPRLAASRPWESRTHGSAHGRRRVNRGWGSTDESFALSHYSFATAATHASFDFEVSAVMDANTLAQEWDATGNKQVQQCVGDLFGYLQPTQVRFDGNAPAPLRPRAPAPPRRLFGRHGLVLCAGGDAAVPGLLQP
jgi:hypothetical protein